MSASNFYRTLYQTDQLFRLPNERWATEQPIDAALANDAPEQVDSSAGTGADLLRELDTLSAGFSLTAVTAAETLLVDKQEMISLPLSADVAATEVVIQPEPLPKAPSRPTIPSVVPPVQQQSRLPQLNHKVLLLADEELDPSNLLFLEKILKAVNLNVDGVDLLNLHGVRDVDFAELVNGKKIHHFITFGVPFNRIHLDIAMDRYQPVRFFGINFLMADSLPTIEADQTLKRRLWAALQQVFLPR